MTKGDFEVMPRGTMEEIKVLRNLVNQLNSIITKEEDRDNFVIEVTRQLGNVNRFYAGHVEKYPPL
jgi:hypothetical protein